MIRHIQNRASYRESHFPGTSKCPSLQCHGARLCTHLTWNELSRTVEKVDRRPC